MPCKEIPMQSVQQIQPVIKFMLPKRLRHITRTCHRNPIEHQLHTGPMYVQDSSSHSQSEDSSSDESFCLQLQIQSHHAKGKLITTPVHLIMNFAYQSKPHYTRNMCLWAQLDTCADVNIMMASIYWLAFKDLEMWKIKPCKMQISTYTADTVKNIGSCTFDIIHLHTKKLVLVTCYVANNEGSVLLSCKTPLALCLIQPRSRLDYLPPWAGLITSTMDHPKKTKLTSLKAHRSKTRSICSKARNTKPCNSICI